MDVDGLLDPAVTLFGYRAGGTLLAIAALEQSDPHHAEIKSMHTVGAARGRGVGRTMLEHLITVARERGYRRISLETGSMAAFAPARSLYARRVRGVRAVRPLPGQPEQHVHDARARRLERTARLVRAAPGADRHERHAVGTGDRAARRLGIEAHEAADADGNLVAVDPPVTASPNDDRHLLLSGADLVVLVALRVRR